MMISLEQFILNNPDRWRRTVECATKLRPWIRSLGDGAYRVCRRPTDKDRAWRPHFVQFAVSGSAVFVECDCEAARFEKACVHIAACYRKIVKRRLAA